jgi:hypothetical protein
MRATSHRPAPKIPSAPVRADRATRRFDHPGKKFDSPHKPRRRRSPRPPHDPVGHPPADSAPRTGPLTKPARHHTPGLEQPTPHLIRPRDRRSHRTLTNAHRATVRTRSSDKRDRRPTDRQSVDRLVAPVRQGSWPSCKPSANSAGRSCGAPGGSRRARGRAPRHLSPAKGRGCKRGSSKRTRPPPLPELLGSRGNLRREWQPHRGRSPAARRTITTLLGVGSQDRTPGARGRPRR